MGLNELNTGKNDNAATRMTIMMMMMVILNF